MCKSKHTHTYKNIHTHIYTCIHTNRETLTHMHIHTRTLIFKHIHTCISNTCMYKLAHSYTNRHTRIHIAYTHIHRHIHTCTHTYTSRKIHIPTHTSRNTHKLPAIRNYRFTWIFSISLFTLCHLTLMVTRNNIKESTSLWTMKLSSANWNSQPFSFMGKTQSV